MVIVTGGKVLHGGCGGVALLEGDEDAMVADTLRLMRRDEEATRKREKSDKSCWREFLTFFTGLEYFFCTRAPQHAPTTTNPCLSAP